MPLPRPAALAVPLVALALAACSPDPLPDGRYLLALDSGSGDAPRIETVFDLEEARPGPAGSTATIRNGAESIEVPVVERSATSLTLAFPHYDSVLTLGSARRADQRVNARGTWRIDRGDKGVAELRATAEPVEWLDAARRPAIVVDRDAPEELSGRWAMSFEASGPGVLELEVDMLGGAAATVRTPTGDYRYLAGRYEPTLREWGPAEPRLPSDVVGRLELSTFDGAHAFALVGHRRRDGGLWGVFVSGDWWVEGWTARRDAGAALPDPLAQTAVSDPAALEALAFRDSETGAERRLVDVLDAQGGRARIVELFGTWCPNCADAARELSDLERVYGPRGLTVLGVAFEATGDFERSARQVRRYRERFDAGWPILIAGNRDKDDATRTFRVLDKVRSYPTLLFLDERNEVVAVHTGFDGPATGEAHRAQRARFEAIIEGLLD